MTNLLSAGELEEIRKRDNSMNPEWFRWTSNTNLTMVDALKDRRLLLAHIEAMETEVARYRFLRDQRPCSLHLTFNEHVSDYMTAKEFIEDSSHGAEWHKNDDPQELQRMKDTNSIWTLQIYPNTPIGFNVFNAASLDAVIDAARKP